MTREQRSLFDRWQTFQQLDRLTEHWYWRPGWRVGRSFYTWHVTFDKAAKLHDLVRRVQAELDVPAIDLVPVEGLHLTMQGLGFSDEIGDADVQAIVAAARECCAGLGPFELEIGPVDPDQEGMGLLVRPWAPVEQLRLALRQAIGSVWGSDRVPEPPAGFRPHVTAGYSASNAPAEEVRGRLNRLRGLPPVTVRIDEAHLIELNRDHREYRWITTATVPLGRAGSVDATG